MAKKEKYIGISIIELVYKKFTALQRSEARRGEVRQGTNQLRHHKYRTVPPRRTTDARRTIIDNVRV